MGARPETVRVQTNIGTPRYGRPLHGQPLLVNYGELTINGKKVPDSTLFIGTNSGYLRL